MCLHFNLVYRYNQYYFRCDCAACSLNWPTYQNLPTTICTKNKGEAAATDTKAVMAEANKLSKGFKKNLDSVLQVQTLKLFANSDIKTLIHSNSSLN